ncbi:50S ribosomal protein L29 [Mycoplasma sp. SG1]|uniref:50S ribosomal protein L29 n=1 Tax=Mycoplasma sp. SG1 TaxID=2810348 RepID=UPI003A4C6B1C|nr:50S ribosomal protein L29 [Mycoplasma sp. SG1]
MDRNELIKKTPQELAKLLFELKQELFVLKFQASMGKLESPAKFKNLKKEVARILTIQIEQSRNLKRIPKTKKTLEKIRLRKEQQEARDVPDDKKEKKRSILKLNQLNQNNKKKILTKRINNHA